MSSYGYGVTILKNTRFSVQVDFVLVQIHTGTLSTKSAEDVPKLFLKLYNA